MSEYLPIFGTLDNRRGQVIGYTLVDPGLFTWLSRWRWNLFNSYVGRYETIIPGRGGAKQSLYLHRVLTAAAPDEQVDHINQNPLDNRLINLRLVFDAENKHNVPARGGSSEFRGVTWDASREKWMAKVKAGGRTHNAGRFDSEWDAALAAKTLRTKLLPLARGVH